MKKDPDSILRLHLSLILLHAALKKDYNSLVRFLLELSTIAAVDQRLR